MLCPYCNKGFNAVTDFHKKLISINENPYSILGIVCPLCHELSILKFPPDTLVSHKAESIRQAIYEGDYEFLVPHKHQSTSVLVPEEFRKDFAEATATLKQSPNASAALSRRCLQNILRNHFGIHKRNLYSEIKEYLTSTDVPSYLYESLDLIRLSGNIGTHPLKNEVTGEIVEVKEQDAKIMLDIIELLFDHVFIKPDKLNEIKRSIIDIT
ncbi:DUF4145 domain-containing protein [Paenibacillus sp. NRS-1775]|uniref:DUF4145 domain-containing protein n=1 Tax=unclassified Paenibacillus TaxID=185978 RepID=UPI003D2943E5